MQRDQPDTLRARDVRRIVVDEHRAARLQPEPRQRQPVDRRIRLHHLLRARHHDVAEAIEHRRFARAERRPEFVAEVGNAEQRHARRLQFVDQRGHTRHRIADALQKPRPPGGD